MKITKIESLQRGEIVVVRVYISDGAVGIGQTAPYGAKVTARVLHDFVAPHFIGVDPWDIEAAEDKFLREQYKFPSSFVLRALAGIDTAVWDVLAKCAGLPVYKLLGGEVRDSVPVYASSMVRDISPEAEANRIADLAASHGYQAAKVRIGEAMGQDRDATPGRTERIIPLMRDVLGPDFLLSADANGGFTVPRAIRVGRILEEHNYFHFEEPCPFPEIENTAQVAAALDIPVSGGEQDNSLPQFYRMLGMKAVDIVQPDIGYIGGISRARKVAVLAEFAGVPCTPHCANDSMLQVFTLHLALAMPTCIHHQEWSIERTPWTAGIYEPVLEVVAGTVAAPNTPGWGIELTPSFISSAESELTI